MTDPKPRRRVLIVEDEAPLRTQYERALQGRYDLIFAATGVTDGALMKGVRFFGDGVRTSSLIMQSTPARIRFIDTIHVEQARMVRVRF